MGVLWGLGRCIGRPSEKLREKTLGKIIEKWSGKCRKLGALGTKTKDSSSREAQKNQARPFLATRRPKELVFCWFPREEPSGRKRKKGPREMQL